MSLNRIPESREVPSRSSILDRITTNSPRIELKGPSLGNKKSQEKL
jgi:hypothetical protein